MQDKKEFMSMLQEVSEIAGIQGGTLPREEIGKYFGDMNLSEEQIGFIQQYLKEKSAEQDTLEKEASKEKGSEAGHFTRYREELERITRITAEEEEDILSRFLEGNAADRERYIEKKLVLVTETVDEYSVRAVERGIPAEELLQEGNLGLIKAVNDIVASDVWTGMEGNSLKQKAEAYLASQIRLAMENLIDGLVMQKDWEDTVVAKTNLIHEAAGYLEKENGRPPSVMELSKYTKMAEDEIADILRLATKAEQG